MTDDIKAFIYAGEAATGTWFDSYRDNAELLAHVHTLGYLTDRQSILDCTYGLGNFWTKWSPLNLTATDIEPADVGAVGHYVGKADFTALPFEVDQFDAVVFDPPYKLNGTDQGEGARYGVDKKVSWHDRMKLIHLGLRECFRVVKPGGVVLVKCQDQVVSGAVVWQRFEVKAWAEREGGILLDMLDMIGGRPQPGGRNQLHARRNASTLLVFVKGRK